MHLTDLCPLCFRPSDTAQFIAAKIASNVRLGNKACLLMVSVYVYRRSTQYEKLG